MEKQPLKLDQTWANVLVSEGTLRTSDLITKFSGVLLDSSENNKIFFHDVFTYDWVDVISFLYDDDLSDEQLQDQQDCLHYLISILEIIAPDGCSFTTLDGDGALFGFWRNNE